MSQSAKLQKKFRVKLDGSDNPNSEVASFELPFDPREVWGKARVPVKGTVNGFSFRSTVATMGGQNFICVNAKIREGAGVKKGDVVSVVIEPDTEPRVIEIPAEMKKALGAKLAAALEKLAYTHKKEFVQWFTETKKEETRLRRVEKMKEMLATGKTIS
jgi:hypothetical protein